MSDDNNLVDLNARRAEKKQEGRAATLASFRPSLGVMAWGALLLFAAVTYFGFQRSDNVATADLSGGVTQSGGIDECGLIRRTCLVDGDTGWQDGTKWRMLAYDAPEMNDKAQCDAERDKARASLARLMALMADGYTIKGNGKTDKFKRALVDVILKDGRNAGAVLLGEGLIQKWPNEGNVWCGL
ncbi:hypothetical protein [Hyphomicrobium sp.]|uniref:thermonuclease family protein n=1 Tax=Hyphomicrobium sp. TaxID=82 RepID=UPI002E372B39|nr:hypothetical protein [Hyphomicrobium sp.]HEX2842143.1 hypothetical protein [Hyphomicrobium sp.]